MHALPSQLNMLHCPFLIGLLRLLCGRHMSSFGKSSFLQ